jgi:hypothetical protein
MNDSAWQHAESATNFFMVIPMDTSHAQVPTEVRMTYDQDNLYIIAICYLASPHPYMVESTTGRIRKNDNFIFFIDPFDDRTNGFTFGASSWP